MGFVFSDRVRETTSSTGTADFSLAGAVSPSHAFSDIGNGNQTYYSALNAPNNEWEIGIGTYVTGSPNKLTRDLVLKNSAGTTAKISFTASPIVWCDVPSFLAAMANVSALANLASLAGAF